VKSRLYTGEIWHARIAPVAHSFRYPHCWFALDLDELPQLNRELRGFGYNRFSLFSIDDRDYLFGSGSLRDRIMVYLAERGCGADVVRVELVTAARFLGYAFNPVSFYYAYRADDSIRCIVAEVNNTFGERHLYMLSDAEDSTKPVLRYSTAKQFHVSPFFDRTGGYQFSFSSDPEQMAIGINLMQGDQVMLASRITGRAAPLSARTLVRSMISYPLSVLLTIPRILHEAAKLKVRKGLPVHARPIPTHSETHYAARPSMLQRISQHQVLRLLGRIKHGYLQVTLPDRTELAFGDSHAPLRASLRVHDPAFFWQVVRTGEIGFGDAYMDGLWDCDDLPSLFRIFVENRQNLDERKLGTPIGRFAAKLLQVLRPNTRAGARRNIKAHYDLSNEFFQTFLDRSMTYSCAHFKDPGETLEQAQRNKYRDLINKARITKTDHVLEIGTGWGGFAIQAVTDTGCRVTTVTISERQYELARQRVAEAGLTNRISVLYCDYRDIEGQYDKIVSIEMFEALGHEYFGTFFAACDRLLKPNGLMALQVITLPDQRYESYRRSADWIQKHIFPGGLTPSLTAMANAATKHSSLIVENVENIGYHYAQTLRLWRHRFEAAWPMVERLGFDDRFRRMWRFYLTYCEAGFESRVLGTLQIVMTRPNNVMLAKSV